ncbi:MAG: A/G-specific adenine glycosylase [Thermomicrobiales bacterium]
MMTEPAEPVNSDQRIHAIREGILTWFDRHHRSLPWRETRDPYRILVSEVMLQQTQVDRVLPYYLQFLERFPTVAELATAPTAEVIRSWAGLGYNRRAVNLQRAAQAVMDRHGGKLPRTVTDLKALPGVGDYTAGAVACFAYEADVSFLDTNMKRVLERVWCGPEGSSDNRTLLGLADELLPGGDSWRWNQALMEFGALHCTARKPLCGLCPLQASCRSFPFAQQSGPRREAGSGEVFEGSNRYFRGKVLAVLRDTSDREKGIPLREIGELVREGFSEADVPWLDRLVRGLERDGLARIAEVAEMYDAGPREPRVTLP